MPKKVLGIVITILLVSGMKFSVYAEENPYIAYYAEEIADENRPTESESREFENEMILETLQEWYEEW